MAQPKPKPNSQSRAVLELGLHELFQSKREKNTKVYLFNMKCAQNIHQVFNLWLWTIYLMVANEKWIYQNTSYIQDDPVLRI